MDDDQHIYIPIFNQAPAAPNCPTNYWWTETKDPMIRVARKVVTDSDNDKQFPELPADEVLPTASTDPWLDYAFHNLGKNVKSRISDQKLGCPDIRTWEEETGTEVSPRARQVTLARETTLYSLKCRQLEVQLATDWDTHTCFKELPVWVNADKPHRSLRFLVPGSRLLLNSSQPKSCITNSQLPPGYQTTSGEWVVLTPRLQLLTSPPEGAGVSTEPEDGGTKARGHSGPYLEGTLYRWAEYHQKQF